MTFHPPRLNNAYEAFQRLAKSQQEYLSQWYLETPAIVTSDKYNELRKVQQLLFAAISYFIRKWDEYAHIFPVPENIRRIITLCAPYPYRTGTYRPDFLIDTNGQIKICEIGARFPLNGYFLSGIAEYIGQNRFPCKSYLDKPAGCLFLDHLFKYWGEVDRLYVLKGIDRPCDIKYYIPFFEALGIKTETLTPGQTHALRQIPAGACLVNEFNQMEMDRMDDETLKTIAASNALNDMRTIFLIHDKRFMAVLSDPDFLSRCLNEKEKVFLSPFLIPTYTSVQAPDLWEEARKYKNEWVLKHALLGKSEQVYTGRTSTEKEWKRLFDPSVKSSMVLQPFIHQERIRAAIKDTPYDDYVVGTLLCMDDHFLGTGLFRTSSFEITNRVDDRKMSSCFTNDYPAYKTPFIL